MLNVHINAIVKGLIILGNNLKFIKSTTTNRELLEAIGLLEADLNKHFNNIRKIVD